MILWFSVPRRSRSFKLVTNICLVSLITRDLSKLLKWFYLNLTLVGIPSKGCNTNCTVITTILGLSVKFIFHFLEIFICEWNVKNLGKSEVKREWSRGLAKKKVYAACLLRSPDYWGGGLWAKSNIFKKLTTRARGTI